MKQKQIDLSEQTPKTLMALVKKNSENSLVLTAQEIEEIGVALGIYCMANNENPDILTLKTWKKLFSELGVPVDKIVRVIKKATMTKKYGATKFSDFTDLLLEEGMLFTYAEMNERMNDRAKIILENVKLEQIEKERREFEMKKENDEVKEELKKFKEDIDYRYDFIIKEVNEVLDNLANKIEKMYFEIPFAQKMVSIIRSERKSV